MHFIASTEKEEVSAVLKEIPFCPKCNSEFVAPFFDGSRSVIQCANCGYFGEPKTKPADVRQPAGRRQPFEKSPGKKGLRQV